MSEKWDLKYQQSAELSPQPALVLSENSHLLPQHGTALDLACGLGGNAIFMAKQGLDVAAWDSSAVAIEKVRSYGQSARLHIDAQIRDVLLLPPEPQTLDVIVVSHFLERQLCSVLTEALRPGGLLFYQTWTRTKVSATGPSNPDYLLDDNELLRLFPSLKLRVYREESTLGTTDRGWRNQSMLVAERIG